jgi:hypothetical protein
MYDPNTAPPPRPGRPHWGAGAVALVVIGLLILIPSGLCTGIFGVGALYAMITSSPGEGLTVLLEALTLGGIPIVIGGLLVFAGFRMRTKR